MEEQAPQAPPDQTETPQPVQSFQERVHGVVHHFFSNASELIQKHFAAVHNDYELLQKVVEIAEEQYEQMGSKAEELNQQIVELFTLYQNFHPVLQQVDMVGHELNRLEAMAKNLDNYTKQLEIRFNKLKPSRSFL